MSRHRNSLDGSTGAEPNYELVRERLTRTRKYRGMNLREAAREIGVSAPTLSRIERGASRPDLPTLDALISWLSLDRSAVYNARPRTAATTPEQVRAVLAADENLDTQSAEAIAAIFEAAYDKLARRAK
jgi:transcriptional regulator with XRE-family HTH domain